MAEPDFRIRDSLPAWMGHPAVVVLVLALFGGAVARLVDYFQQLEDAVNMTGLVMKCVGVLTLGWLCWVTVSVWLRDRHAKT